MIRNLFLNISSKNIFPVIFYNAIYTNKAFLDFPVIISDILFLEIFSYNVTDPYNAFSGFPIQSCDHFQNVLLSVTGKFSFFFHFFKPLLQKPHFQHN